MPQVTGNYRVHGEVFQNQVSGNVLILKKGPNKLNMQPEVVHIRPNGRVSWWIWDDVVPEGGSIEIEFADQDGIKGPFKQRQGDPANPARGKYTKAKGRALGIVTDDADQGSHPHPPGYWKYTVRVLDAKGNVLIEDDPGVAIDPGSALESGN